MPTDDPPRRPGAVVADFLRGRTDELTSAWAEHLARCCPGDNGNSALREQAASLVDEAIARIGNEAEEGSADPAHAHAFAAAAMQAGMRLPQLLSAFEFLAGLMVRATRDEVITGGSAAPVEAFDTADRIHRAVSPLGSALAEAWQRGKPRAGPSSSSERFEDFARTIAHELKNPLGAARGAAELLATGEGMETPELRARFAELVLRNVNRALELLDDVRRMTRIASPPGAAGDESQTLATLLDDVLHEVQQQAESTGVIITLPDRLPDATFDAMRLRVALMNLVWNAIKYSDPAKNQRWVRIEAECERGRCRIEVIDNGLGIPHDAHQHVFSRHFRAHPEHASGTGLGLALTREAIREAGGDIEFVSDPGAGSTFRIIMPVRESRSDEVAAD